LGSYNRSRIQDSRAEIKEYLPDLCSFYVELKRELWLRKLLFYLLLTNL
jgi:hypothetical protein